MSLANSAGIEVPKLFAIASRAQLKSAGQEWLDALLEAGAALWLRDKGLADREMLAFAREIRRKYAGLLTISSRFDIARAAGADGVHLPAQGLPAGSVRDAWPTGLLGRSIHSVGELPGTPTGLLATGCDYVTLSPVFETPSKAGVPALGTQVLVEAARLEGKTGVKIIALGGIDELTVVQALDSGAHGVAAIRGLQSLRTIEGISSLLRKR